MFHKALLLVAMPLVILISSSGYARGEPSVNVLTQVRELTLRCVVQPVQIDRTGRQVYGQPRSTCVELQASGARAVIYLGRAGYQAVLTRSENADGNDLNHLFIYFSGRPVAQLRNVAAFGNILIALAGGTTEFRQIDR